MSRQYARSAAEKLVADVDSPPIKPEVIARRLGVPVIKDALGETSGLLVTRDNKAVIYVNSGQSPVRQRFSAAHELGHHCLQHHNTPGEHVHVDKGLRIMRRSSRAAEGVDPMEIEANQFAAVLLMPTRLVRMEVAKLGDSLSEDDVGTLATAFQVSEQAMTIRLTSLGYSLI